MIYIKETHVGFLKVQEKRYLERVKSDLKLLKDVSCSVELVGKNQGTFSQKIFLHKRFKPLYFRQNNGGV